MKLTFWIGFLFGFIVTFFICIKKLDKNKRLLLAFTITALLVSAPFVYCMITIKSPIGFIYPEQYDAWISFFGSIIGGILTVLGVWWTIDDQNKQRINDQKLRDKERKEELAIQYKPLIKFEPISHNISSTENVHTLSFNIKNVGRGEANEIMIVFDDDVEIIDSNTEEKNTYYINTFPSGELHPVKIKYKKILKGDQVKEIDRVIEFDVFYRDLFSVYDFTTIGQIFIHPKAWPHMIKSINGEIKYEKINKEVKE